MVKRNIEQLKKEVVDRLLVLDPKQIILFGSFAYGTPTETSDLDICIVKETLSHRYEETAQARELLKDIAIEKDIIMETETFLKEHSGNEWINTAWYDIAHDGEVLYEKR